MNTLYTELINAIAAILVAAVPIITGAIVMWLRSRWKLAGILASQARMDKLNAAIQNQIRAEAEKLKDRYAPAVGGPGGQVIAPSINAPGAKGAIVNAVVPKIEEAFKETLNHFDIKKGSPYLKDIILGQVETAIKAPDKPVIPSVMARS